MIILKNNEIKYFKPKIKEQDIVITIDINSVTNIKQIEQKFECVLRVKIEWLPSIEDLYFILSHGIDKYVPNWIPLDLIFLNKYDIKSEKKVGPFLTKSNGKYKNVYYYYYNISFIDKVELNNFPFDIQDLEIEMELPKSENYNINWIINNNDSIVNQLSEWQYKDIQHSCHNNINKKYKSVRSEALHGNTNHTAKDLIYESVKQAWVIGKRRGTVEYVLAEYKGIIVEVYEVIEVSINGQIEKWYPVSGYKNRWGFHGKKAIDDVRSVYINKSISHHKKRGAANPVRYRL